MKMLKTLLVALSSPASSLMTAPSLVQRGRTSFLSHIPNTHSATSHSCKRLSLLAASRTGGTSSSSSSQKRRRRPSLSSNSSNSQSHKKGKFNGQQRRSHSNSNSNSNRMRRQNNPQKRGRQIRLPEPTVLFTNNHLLVVNKPAGYHSQPNDSVEMKPSKKCLLSKLKTKELGGGSAKNFLLPMHRLDQPCTGVLLLAKNSKAGTRTGNAFRKHLVQKDYLCVVEGDLDAMTKRSELVKSKNGNMMCKLSGVLMPNKGRGGNNNNNKGGKSVVFKPLKGTSPDDDRGRVCFLEWEHLLTVEGNRKSGRHLVRVVTGTGAKHQVRAMMAQLAKSPLCGDLRYGAREPLPDQSVALHARSLHLPTVSLGETDMKKLRFIAPVPSTWSTFFSLKESRIPEIKYN